MIETDLSPSFAWNTMHKIPDSNQDRIKVLKIGNSVVGRLANGLLPKLL